MAYEPTGNPVGRPPKPLNKKEFEKLCHMLCTTSEIAAYFEMSKDTLYEAVKREYKENFSTIYAQKKEGGKISLRRKQHQLAEKSAAVAIFLGKNYLGQSDKQEIVQETTHKVEGIEAFIERLDREADESNKG